MKVTINGRVHDVHVRTLSYDVACLLDGMVGAPSGTYRYPNGEKGIFSFGDRLAAADGLTISLCHTGSA